MRKNTRDAKVQLEKLCQELTSLPSRFGFTKTKLLGPGLDKYWDCVEELNDFVKSNETKIDKDTCLTKIRNLKQKLQLIEVL